MPADRSDGPSTATRALTAAGVRIPEAISIVGFLFRPDAEILIEPDAGLTPASAPALAAADVVVKSRYESDASQGVPIEPRTVLGKGKLEELIVRALRLGAALAVRYRAHFGVDFVVRHFSARCRLGRRTRR